MAPAIVAQIKLARGSSLIVAMLMLMLRRGFKQTSLSKVGRDSYPTDNVFLLAGN